jgi:hypothetical protein
MAEFKPARLSMSAALAAILASYLASAPSAAGTVTVTSISADHSAVKITFNPVPGAKDYRVYDVANPANVKYGGLVHLSPSPNCPGTYCQNHFVTLGDGVTPVVPYQIAGGAAGGPNVIDGPALQIDWNNVGDGARHTLIVEAVDQLGPAPPGNLYTGLQNVPFMSPPPSGYMLGSNKGPTPDGKTSTNGQGPYSNSPLVIAQSAPFVVQANQNYRAIPSMASATQQFFDSFENAEGSTLQQISRNDTVPDAFGNLGTMSYRMNAGTARAWEIEFRRTDNMDSMPMIASDHYMDLLFDGATPGTTSPTHTIFGSMSMTPTQTLNISGGRMMHMTMEVDGHQSLRRWLDFNLAPVSDPLKAWHPDTEPINNTDQGIFLEIKDGTCTLDIYTGPDASAGNKPTGTAGGGNHGARLWGQPGSTGGAPVMCGWDQMFLAKNATKNGLGLDDKSRYDFFLSATHAAFFQDGVLIVESDIPAGSFPWSEVPLKGYYSHYMYHSDQERQDLGAFEVSGQNWCFPLNSYWFNNPSTGTTAGTTICNTAYPSGYGFVYSDERHWDNMGYEVLTGSDVPVGSFASLAALVQPPPQQTTISLAPSSPTGLRIVGLITTLFDRFKQGAFAR